MKDVELKLACELMKNSRRSDRELARTIGASQPTITRIRGKMEKEGIIREYTMIPDLSKLGYKLMGITFIKMKAQLTQEQFQKAQMQTKMIVTEAPSPSLMIERGIGLGYDGIMITLFRNYTEYMNFVRYTRSLPFIETGNVESFLVNMMDDVHFHPLSLSMLAKHLLKLKKEEEKK